MRKVLAVMAAVLITSTTAGCTGGNWFANPAPTTPEPAAPCAVRDVPEATPFDPLTHGRPAVPDGWRWQVITLTVRALPPVDQDLHRDYCVPVAIHVYATLAESGALALVNVDGLPQSLPYDAIVNTPWTGAYLVPAYDPESPRFKSAPPAYSITLQATYLAERDFTGAEPAALHCNLGLSGVPVASDTAITVDRASVFCELKNDTYRT